jgi:hypothetical protein
MSFKFFRRVKIIKNLNLNLSKKGYSWSYRFFIFTLNKKGNKYRFTVNLPIKGLSWSKTFVSKIKKR